MKASDKKALIYGGVALVSLALIGIVGDLLIESLIGEAGAATVAAGDSAAAVVGAATEGSAAVATAVAPVAEGGILAWLANKLGFGSSDVAAAAADTAIAGDAAGAGITAADLFGIAAL